MRAAPFCGPQEVRGSPQSRSRWAAILAGGRGSRLQSLTRRLFGKDQSGEGRPKQFCALFGGNTLLGHTRARVASVIPAERTAFVVVKSHAPYYDPELAGVDRERILAQPVDRGTTAAIAFALARIAVKDPEAVIGFYPADHYFADEAAFSTALEDAYCLAERHRDSLLLLGAQPEHPEVEYGWIEPGEALLCGDELSRERGIFRVNRFWEKPSVEVARGLLERGCLWNTFVMVGRVRAFLEGLREAAPLVFGAFDQEVAASNREDAVGRVYASLQAGDFSRQVLSAIPDRLAVLRLDNAGWSDLGTPERVKATWARCGMAPLEEAEAATSFSR